MSTFALNHWSLLMMVSLLVAACQETAYHYFHQALWSQMSGKYDQAIADYTKALETDPRDAFAYHNRGVAYSQKRQYDQAIRRVSQEMSASNILF